MITNGTEVLGWIESAVQQQMQRVEEASDQLAALSNSLLDIRQSELEHTRQLVNGRIDFAAPESLLKDFSDAAQNVGKFLAERDSAALDLLRESTRLERSANTLAGERDEQARILDQAIAAQDLAETGTQQRLAAEEAHRTQEFRAAEAGRVAHHSREKAEFAASQQAARRSVYENQPLFMYLLRRHYGASNYRANPLTRMLDRHLDKLIGFSTARSHYLQLEAIPKALAGHAEDCQVQANAEYELLREFDAEARLADNIPALESVVAREREKLQALDASIVDMETQTRLQQDRRERFAAGHDRHYQSAIDCLTAIASQALLTELRQRALICPYPEDDAPLGKLLLCEKASRDTDHSRKDMRQLLKHYRERLAQLQALRTEFKQRDYDKPRLGFADGGVVELALGSYLAGSLNGDSFWAILQHQCQSRPGNADPAFGSGGFGRGSQWGPVTRPRLTLQAARVPSPTP